MINKICAFICLLVTVAACKKSDAPSVPLLPAEINPVGTWSLVSFSDQQGSNIATYTSSDFPCLADNKIYINSDGTLKSKYTGQDSCLVFHTSMSSLAIGIPGDSTVGTWTESNNNIYSEIATRSSRGQLSTTYASSQIIQMDTVTSLNTVYTTIYKK
jgi:hypothetical protein